VRRFGWAQSVAAVVLSFALRFRSIEDTKNALRRDLGIVIGTGQAPSVDDVRLKIQRMTESIDPVALSREMFRHYLALDPVWEGLYYVDGHFCPYYGEHPTPRGWNPQRRLATPGHTDTYVHDAQGRALFFLSQPLNSSLARAIPALVEEICKVHGAKPFTLVFDRGGYSADAFRFLASHNIGFITYLKGRKARRRYPQDLFHTRWFLCEGQRHVYRTYEKRTRIAGVGALRTVIWLDEDGQIPVLTNLGAFWKPAKLVHCLRLRWRQENSFKYLTEHYGIDQIIQYGADKEEEARLVKNPKREVLKGKIRSVQEEIERLEAELGRALDTNSETQRPTSRGLKIAHGRLRRELTERRQVMARLRNRLERTPAQISAEEAGAPARRSLLREDRRIFVNSLKLAAHNAERMLALDFVRHYRERKDFLSVFRALLHLGGAVHRSAPDELEVFLDRPRPEKVALALEALTQQVNEERARMLGDGPVLRFRVRELT
jgi:hypothetical protein